MNNIFDTREFWSKHGGGNTTFDYYDASKFFQSNNNSGRSLWNRFIDVVGTSNYAVAGFARGFVDDKINPIEGMFQGLYAGLSGFIPFNQGNEKWEYDFSGVLEEAGWKPETLGGKIAKGAVGIGLDILLDPMTYVSGGSSALIKGSGQHSLKQALKYTDDVADGVKLIGNIGETFGKYADDIKDMTKGVGMSFETAMDIVQNSKVFKSGKFELDVFDEAKKLMNEYNNLIGINNKVDDITFSLANAPLGKKIFGRYADKSVTLVSSDRLKFIGDMTIAPHYAKLRDSVLGGQIGKLFSTNHQLYKLAKTNPEQVYNYIKQLEMARGLTKGKLNQKDIIKANAELMKNLTPAEQKEILDIMEDKTKWHKVTQMIRFRDTDEVEKYRKKIKLDKEETEKNLNKARRNKSYNKLRVKKFGDSIKEQKEILEQLNKQRVEAINSINIEKAIKEGKLDDVIIETVDATEDLKINLDNVINIEDSIKKFRTFKSVKEGRDLELEVRKELVDTFFVENGLDVKIGQTILDKINKNEFTKPSTASRTTWGKYIKEIKEYGFKEFTRKGDAEKAISKMTDKKMIEINKKLLQEKSKEFDDLYNQAQKLKSNLAFGKSKKEINKEIMPIAQKAKIIEDEMKALKETISNMKDYDWQLVRGANGKYRIYPPKEYINIDLSPFNENVYSKLDDIVTDKNSFVDDLSTYIFGKKGYLSYTSNDRELDVLIEKIERGAGIHELADHVFTNRTLFNGSAKEMWSFIAHHTGYGQGTKFPTWQEYYYDQLDELFKKQDLGTFNEKDEIKVAELLKAKLNRDYLKGLFADAITYDDHKKIIEGFNNDIARTTEEIIDKLYVDGLKGARLEDLKRNKWSIEDYLEEHKTGALRQWHKPDKKAEVFNLNAHQKEDVVNNLISALNFDKDASYIKLIDENTEKLKFLEDSFKKNNIIIDRLESQQKSIEKYINKYSTEVESIKDGIINTTKKLNPDYDPERALRLQAVYDSNREKLIQLNKKKADLSNGINNAKNYNPKKDNKGFMRMVDELSDELEFKLSKMNKEYGQLLPQERFDLVKKTYNEINIKSMNKNKKSVIQQKEDYERILNQIIDLKKGSIQKETVKQLKIEFVNSLKRNDIIEFTHESNVVKGVINVVKDDNGKKIFSVELPDGKEVETTGNLIKGRRKIGAVEEARKLDDIKDVNQLYDDFVVRQTELYDKVKKLKQAPKNFSVLVEKPIDNTEALNQINQEIGEKLSKVEEQFAEKINKITETIDKFENKATKNTKKYLDYLDDEENYVKQIKEMEEAINSIDALETYIEANYGVDVNSFTEKVVDMILDPNLDISFESRKVINTLREEFIKMGAKEVGIGKLTEEQFEAMMYEYLPHILTPEGQKFFSEGKDIPKKLKNFGDDFGYGREFDPFAKSRKIKGITLDGKYIENPTVRQINEYFSKELKGKNVFQESIADIYLARALKHNDLMYDNKYMEQMLEIFGEDYVGEFKEGFTTVMNYGMLKQYTSQIVRLNNSLDISDNIAEHIKQNKLLKRFGREADDVLKTQRILDSNEYLLKRKKIVNQKMKEYIDKYMKETLTDEVRKEMYLGNLENFFKNTGTSGMLDDIAIPLGQVSDEQIKSLNSTFEALQNRYINKIKKSYASLYKLDVGTLGNVKVEDIEKALRNSMDSFDEIDIERVNRIFDRIEELNNLSSPQIKQVNEAIVQKANQARKSQIIRENNQFLDLYDKFTHFIKLNQTTVLPGFHMRNKYSNMFNNWLAVGKDAVDIDFQRKTLDVLRGKIDPDEMLEIITPDGFKTKVKWSDLLRKAEEFEVIDSGMFAKELGAQSGTDGILGNFFKGVNPKYDPTSTKEFIGYKVGSKVGSTIEGHDRFIHFASQVKNGMSFEDASKSVNEFLFDYSDLTYFEQNVMKRIFPYYTWLRKNSALQLTQMLEQPGKYRMVSKIIGGVEGMTNEDERVEEKYVNGFAQDWVQLPFDIDGEPVLLNPNLPYLDLNRIPNPLDPIGSLKEAFTQSNPLIKTPIELALNKNVFFDKPIVEKGQNYIMPVAMHGARQFGVVPVVEGIVNKSGAEFGLHMLGNTLGIKATPYNYEAFKARKIDELQRKKDRSKSNPGILDSIRRRLGQY